jgi:membrane protease YdiL (CAAX protease family)
MPSIFSPHALGLGRPSSWPWTIALAIVWLLLMLAYSPLADKVATRLIAAPPTLNAFRSLQQSKAKLVLGILVAWILGAFLEELVLRGFVLQSVRRFLAPAMPSALATALAICAAAALAALLHLYQGVRAVVIITQLSILFGVLFVASGFNLCPVILCHGLYDTIAFIRFATKKSKYANLESSNPAG